MKTLDLLNTQIGSWIDIDEQLHKKYYGFNSAKKRNVNGYDFAFFKASELRNNIANHTYQLIYNNIIGVYVREYFFENYMYLNTEIIKTYIGEDIYKFPFMDSLYKTIQLSRLNSIKIQFGDLLTLGEDYLAELILNTWKKVEKDIESKTLKLELF